jgi:hypothetical protein
MWCYLGETRHACMSDAELCWSSNANLWLVLHPGPNVVMRYVICTIADNKLGLYSLGRADLILWLPQGRIGQTCMILWSFSNYSQNLSYYSQAWTASVFRFWKVHIFVLSPRDLVMYNEHVLRSKAIDILSSHVVLHTASENLYWAATLAHTTCLYSDCT